MSEHGIEASPGVSITYEELKRQIKAVTDPLNQQLAQRCELMQELRCEKAHRRHEETACTRATISSSTIAGLFDTFILLAVR